MPTTTWNDVAAVVVLYRPASDVVFNVAAFGGQVDRVFAIDNSETPNADVVNALSKMSNVEYIPLGDNLGIATALNIGARHALEAGYTWVLTMDQDSTATPGMVARMLGCLGTDTNPDTIGILGAEHHQVGGNPRASSFGNTQVPTTMTSGNLLQLAAWEKVGMFLDDLFIDQVDSEFCLRLARHGYRVIEVGGAVLQHRVGATTRHRFPYPAFASNHSPLRRYYITRNRFVVARKYRSDFPEYGRFEMRQMAKETVKILLYEASKTEKLGMMWRGYRDYRAGHMGRLEEPR
jgi:rhamnosyltransferase